MLNLSKISHKAYTREKGKKTVYRTIVFDPLYMSDRSLHVKPVPFTLHSLLKSYTVYSCA